MALPSLRRAAGLPHHRIAAVALLAGCSCLGLGVGRLGWSADFAAAATAASAAAAPTPAEVTPQAGVAPATPAPAPSAGVGGQAAPPAAAGQALPAGAPRILHRVVFGEGGWCALSFRRIRAAFHESNPGWEEWVWGADEVAEVLQREGRAVDRLLQLRGGNFTKYFRGLRREWVKQTDVIRYVLLLLFGGLFMDMDVECRKSVAPLVARAPVVLRKGCKSNWISSWPSAHLWVLLLREVVTQNASRAALEHTGEGRLCALLRRLSLDGSWGGGQCPDDGRGACGTCEDDDPPARSACSRNSSVFFVPVATIGEFRSQGSPLAPGQVCVHRSFQSWKHKRGADGACSDVYSGALQGEALLQRSREILAARRT